MSNDLRKDFDPRVRRDIFPKNSKFSSLWNSRRSTIRFQNNGTRIVPHGFHPYHFYIRFPSFRILLAEPLSIRCRCDRTRATSLFVAGSVCRAFQFLRDDNSPTSVSVRRKFSDLKNISTCFFFRNYIVPTEIIKKFFVFFIFFIYFGPTEKNTGSVEYY